MRHLKSVDTKTLDNIRKSFDHVNTIYGQMMEDLAEDEGPRAEQVFLVMLNVIYNHPSIVTWNWDSNRVVFRVGSVFCRTTATELADGNTEITTDIMY